MVSRPAPPVEPKTQLVRPVAEGGLGTDEQLYGRHRRHRFGVIGRLIGLDVAVEEIIEAVERVHGTTVADKAALRAALAALKAADITIDKIEPATNVSADSSK